MAEAQGPILEVRGLGKSFDVHGSFGRVKARALDGLARAVEVTLPALHQRAIAAPEPAPAAAPAPKAHSETVEAP